MRSDPTFEVLERERQRLASILEREVIDALQLMLAQAGVYEQTFAANAQARLAISVLSKLTRELLQQVRDLETALRPTVLDDVGLEAALQTLAVLVKRTSGIQVQVEMQGNSFHLDHPVRLALYRLIQQLIEGAAGEGHASQVQLHLESQPEGIRVQYRDDRVVALNREPFRAEIGTLEGYGTTFTWEGNPHQCGVTMVIPVRTAFTPTEYRVLRHLGEGLSNKQIAAEMNLSPRTVNFHLDNIYSKMGVNSRTEAVIFALQNHLLDSQPR